MTIQLPDDMAQGLQAIATAQRKSVEEVAVETLRSLLPGASSPAAVLKAVRKLAHPSFAEVEEIEAAIASARLPVHDLGAFDR